MKLVPLTEPALEAATDLWHQGWRDGHLGLVPDALLRYRTRATFLDRLRGHLGKAVLAEADGQLLGLYILDEDELYQFYVAAAARGTGVALSLIRAAEQDLRQHGHSTAWLACSVGNVRAARFYEKAGWTRIRAEGFDAFTPDGPIWVDAWRYEKDLTNHSGAT